MQVFVLKICFLRQTHPCILVEWKNIDYNLGNFFDGTYFTVPENGLYSFHVHCGQKSRNVGTIYLHHNNGRIYARRAESNDNFGFINIDATLKLAKNDKIHVGFYGHLFYLADAGTTYFEGRMIARLDE